MDSVAVAQPEARESLIIGDGQECKFFANCCRHSGLKNENSYEVTVHMIRPRCNPEGLPNQCLMVLFAAPSHGAFNLVGSPACTKWTIPYSEVKSVAPEIETGP